MSILEAVTISKKSCGRHFLYEHVKTVERKWWTKFRLFACAHDTVQSYIHVLRYRDPVARKKLVSLLFV